MDIDDAALMAGLEKYIHWLHSDEIILADARERYAAGQDIRGLQRPNGAPPGSYYTVQHRRLRNGEIGVYLYLRWPPRPDESPGRRGKVAIRPARSLGRLN